MFEVDEFDEVEQPKPKVSQRRGSTGGSPHHDFGRHGMFEIPSASEDESTEPSTPKTKRRASSNASADRPMTLQMGNKPPGHIYTEHLMFEIPDADIRDESAITDATPQLNDAATETAVPLEQQTDGIPAAVNGTTKEEADKINGTDASEAAEEDAKLEQKAEENGAPPSNRKKEKKKKSEEERKERKEKKKQAAIANGSIPVELTGGDASTTTTTGPQPSNKPKTQNRPTTDPLRIYRRCCSLRETTPLPRVVEQLSSPTVCDPLNPAVVLSLDLSNETISMQDLVTLGDWLGVVPVQKILLENAGLTDESVRIVLCGLLTVKTSEQARHNKHLAKKHGEKPKAKKERLGVVSKISLKNNRLIGRQGWMHIAYFINMSKSLKAIDLSLIPFPKPPVQSSPSRVVTSEGPVVSRPGSGNSDESTGPPDPFDLFAKCMAERQGGDTLDEVVMGECDLSGDRVEKLINAVIACRCSRFGLANNRLDKQGLHAVARYIRSGNCLGLDLGGNDLSNPTNQKIILDALDYPENGMFALSLAQSNLTPSDLKAVLPILANLNEFRFIDLSHNHKLFESKPDALSTISRYFPRMRNLKRFHLNDVSMSPEQAIALAEICPEIPSIAHVSILQNPALTALSDAKDEEAQEEACALYASLMAATRVSRTIVCIDIDVPSKDNSEVVKALAKQVVAYSLRNMERGEAYKSAAALISEPHGGEKAVTVPDVLLHLVGHVDNLDDDNDDEPPAPDQDYLVGGTGVVKALSVVLGNRSNHRDSRRLSRDGTPVTSGASTPKLGDSFAKGKAKDMSRNLLESARKIRHRLQPALVRARADASDDLMGSENYRRLFHLDSTLERMIQRFEEEYPECRPPRPQSVHAGSPLVTSGIDLPTSLASPFPIDTLSNPLDETAVGSGDEDGDGSVGSLASSLRRSRHGSDVSLASRNLVNEEGRIHKFGARVKREILPPVHTVDHHWGTKGDGAEPEHLNELRARLEAKGGDEIKKEIEEKGVDVVLKEMNATVEALRVLKEEGGGAWEKCVGAGISAIYLGDEKDEGGRMQAQKDAVGDEEDSGLELSV